MGKQIVYAVVPVPGKRDRKRPIVTKQQRKHRADNGEERPESTDMLEPQHGFYVLDDGHDFHKERSVAMESHMKRHNLPGKPPVVIGPFKETDKLSAQQVAMVEIEKVRTRTDAEKIAKLEAENASMSKGDKGALQKRIKELETALAEKEKTQ